MMEREYNDMNRYPRPERTPPESFGKCSKKPRGVCFWVGFTLAFMTFVPLWAYCLYRAITQLPAEQQLLAGIDNLLLWRGTYGRYSYRNNRMMENKWEQRRYEIAKDIITACVNNNELLSCNTGRALAEWSVDVADALIKELKR